MALSPADLRKLKRQPVEGRNRVRVAMQLAGLTQVQVAEHLQITQTHVSRIVRGEYEDVPLETTRALAELFGCSIEDLFPSAEQVA